MISDEKKLDILWKRFNNLTETDYLNKDLYNEVIPSYINVLGSEVWAQSGEIPIEPPLESTAIVAVYKDATIAKFVEDTTAVGSRAWLAVDAGGNRLRDWISPSLGINYAVRITTINEITGEPEVLNPTKLNSEYVFDYIAGVLYFPNCVPVEVLETGAQPYIEGYRYTGIKGVGTGSNTTITINEIESEYEICGSVFGKPVSNDIVMRFVVTTPIKFEANFSTSQGYTHVLPSTTDVTFNILKNGGVFGRMTFRKDSNGYAVFRCEETVLLTRDILLVQAPANVDPDIQDIEWTLVAKST